VSLDPFDLPEWLGTGQVTWEPTATLAASHRVEGVLRSGSGTDSLACALLAVDDAVPVPVATDAVRVAAQRAWQRGEVVLLEDAGLTLAVPGTRLDSELAMTALARLAKAVGADPARYAVLLRLSRR
jgi:hypothetical protein